MKVEVSESKHEIPIFSERMKRKIGLGVSIIVSALFLIMLLEMEGNGETKIVMLGIGWLVSYMIADWCLDRFSERCKWRLQNDCIRRIMPGSVRDITYEEIFEALQAKKVKITMDAFLVPKRRGYLVFYYEVGNGGAQREIKKSYEFLAAKMPVELPKMTQRLIGQMDRSFLYRKVRRSCSFFMLLASLLMLFVERESLPTNIILVILGQYIQFHMLNGLFKGIYFGKITEGKIQEITAAYPNTKLRRVRVSYAQMAIIVLLTAALNLLWIFV